MRAYDLEVSPPAGWEARIFRRPEAGELGAADTAGMPPAPPGELSFPVVHVATIPLPIDMADYGSDVVDELGPNDALVIVKEFDPAGAGQPLFARPGFPRSVDPAAFDPAALQRRLDSQAGLQIFFNAEGRAFCLYVVLGSFEQRMSVVPRVNEVLATFTIGGPTPPGS